MPKRNTSSIPFKVIPMGGLDGIGKNMTVFEYGDDMIIIDAGLMFPDDEQLGIDLVLPDYSYVLENEHKLKGIVITHGHEDHIGALPYLLADLNVRVPIYSSKLTLGMIEGKLAEHQIKKPRFKAVHDGTSIQLGAIEVNFFNTTHSIPAAFGIVLKTPAGTVLHTGDFKLDQTPIDGVKPNYAAINKFASEGIDLLLSDSTNSTRPGMTPSEAAVGPALRHIIKNAQGRVFVASFSSHIHRLQQICDASVAVGRKVVVTGRSMLTNTKVARELGYLKIADDNIIDAYDVEKMPDEKIVVMCTGSQGEPLSALARMANGEHKSLSIGANDTVIISATPVPGNEKAVQAIINSLSKIGCDVYDKSRALVHVSGHGSSEELKLMLAMVHPRYFAPVHGEAVHLRAHAKLAEEVGVDPKKIFIIDNGDTLELKNHRVRRGKAVQSGVVYVDGLNVTDADPIVLRDRQRLAQDGMVTCVVTMSPQAQKALDVEISGRGVSFANDDALLSDAENLIKRHVEKIMQSGGGSTESLRKSSRNALTNFLWSKTHTRPMVIPVVLEV